MHTQTSSLENFTPAVDSDTLARATRMNATELSDLVTELRELSAIAGAPSMDLVGRVGLLAVRLENSALALEQFAEREAAEREADVRAAANQFAATRAAARRIREYGA